MFFSYFVNTRTEQCFFSTICSVLVCVYTSFFLVFSSSFLVPLVWTKNENETFSPPLRKRSLLKCAISILILNKKIGKYFFVYFLCTYQKYTYNYI